MFYCKLCGKAYKRKSSLYNHNRWECGKEPQFKCNYCPYRGRQKIHYIMHVMAKHKEHKHEVLRVGNESKNVFSSSINDGSIYVHPLSKYASHS